MDTENFINWKQQIIEMAGVTQYNEPDVIFRTYGRHGWSEICFNDNGVYLKHGQPGLHQTDASPIEGKILPERYLFGIFDHNTDTGKYYWIMKDNQLIRNL